MKAHGAYGSYLLKQSVGSDFPMFVRGTGVELHTATGDVVIDAASGVGVTCLGYDAEPVVRRMTEQATNLPYAHALRFETPAMLELAAKVQTVAPGDLSTCFFASGGSEAMESALKCARQYWIERGLPNKRRVIGRRPSFHGASMAALSVGWYAERRKAYAPYLFEALHAPTPNPYRGCSACDWAPSGCTEACADDLERILLEEGPENVAPFIAEPIVGAAGGALVPPQGYFARIEKICRRYDVLFVADEVITGFGRTGRWFGVEHEGVTPDILVFAKGIGAGYAALGGIIVSSSVAEVIHSGSGAFQHNFTLSGHTIACAVGCAVLDEFNRLDLVSRVANGAGRLQGALDRLWESELVGDIRGRGYLWGIELVADRASRRSFSRSQRMAARVAARAIEEGLLVYPGGGSDGDSDYLLVMPPFVMPEEMFDDVAERLLRAIRAVQKDL